MIRRDLPLFPDLPAFMAHLEREGRLVRIRAPVSVEREITEIHRRVIVEGGPALLFEQPILPDGSRARMPLLANLFGTVERVAWGLGIRPERLPELGDALCELRSPRAPRGLGETLKRLPLAKAVLASRPREVREDPERVAMGAEIDLTRLPVQICWPGDAGPLITWPIVVTRPPDSTSLDDYNLGIYRMQVIGPDRAILRWLAHRGGAAHHREWAKRGLPMPVAVAIGADPATILSAVTPLPDGLSELRFAGLVGGRRAPVRPGLSVAIAAPPAQIVLEGTVDPEETAMEGPFGDHTGYYNAAEPFPVMRITAIREAPAPVYLSTFTGRAPDEPSRLGEALNELFTPLVRQQFPEVRDVWLPPETCSYRVAIVSIAKRYPGHARRIMLGLWSMLPQFTYTKLVIVVDDDIDVRRWDDVMWAVATRADPSRDLCLLERTPIDYLDFASPLPGLGGKLGIDATNKIGAESGRDWGDTMLMDQDTRARIDGLWPSLGLGLRAGRR